MMIYPEKECPSPEDSVYTIVRQECAEIRVLMDEHGQIRVIAPLQVSEIYIRQKIARTILCSRLIAPEYDGTLEMTFPLEGKNSAQK